MQKQQQKNNGPEGGAMTTVKFVNNFGTGNVRLWSGQFSSRERVLIGGLLVIGRGMQPNECPSSISRNHCHEPKHRVELYLFALHFIVSVTGIYLSPAACP